MTYLNATSHISETTGPGLPANSWAIFCLHMVMWLRKIILATGGRSALERLLDNHPELRELDALFDRVDNPQALLELLCYDGIDEDADADWEAEYAALEAAYAAYIIWRQRVCWNWIRPMQADTFISGRPGEVHLALLDGSDRTGPPRPPWPSLIRNFLSAGVSFEARQAGHLRMRDSTSIAMGFA